MTSLIKESLVLIRMIYAHDNTGIAVLQDGQTYWLKDSKKAITIKPYKSDPIAVLKMHSRYGIVARTQTGRFLFVHDRLTSKSDITADIEAALSASIDEIEDFGVDAMMVVAQTKRKVCTINFCFKSHKTVLKNQGSAVFETKSDIDLFSFGYGHGFIRTSEGLHSIGDIALYCPNEYRFQEHRMQHVEFDEVANIKEIVCGPAYALFLMIDGRVFAQGYGHGSEHTPTSSSPIIQVKFRHIGNIEGDLISKIVVRDTFIFYISTNGTCYHTCTQLRSGSRPNPCLHPRFLVPELDFFVENVIILDDYVILQREIVSTTGLEGGSPLVGNVRMLDASGIGPDHYILNFLMYQSHMYTFYPTTFFDDKPIVSVVQLKYHAIFITESGHAYQKPHDSDGDTDMQLIPCFSTGNIAVPAPTQAIRSAQSMLDHDA